MGLDTYITLQEAVQRFNLDSTLLTTMIDRGKIRGGKLNGTFVLLERDVQRMVDQRAIEQTTRRKLRQKVAHLDGRTISMSEAARKYSLRQQSISRWAQAGYIRVVCHGSSGQPTMVDESDVAYAKELVDLQSAGQGKRVFAQELIPDWF